MTTPQGAVGGIASDDDQEVVIPTATGARNKTRPATQHLQGKTNAAIGIQQNDGQDQDEEIVDNNRRALIRSRAAYYGHVTRHTKTLMKWCSDTDLEIMRALSNGEKLRKVSHQMILDAYEEFHDKLVTAWSNVEEAQTRVLEAFEEEGDDPQVGWIAKREVEVNKALLLALKTKNNLQAEIDRGENWMKYINPTQDEMEKRAQRRAELRTKFRIGDVIGIFDGKDELQYLPWRQQWTKVESEMAPLFSKGEMLTKLKMRLAGEPKEMLKGCLDTDEYYETALNLLDQRYKLTVRDVKKLVDTIIDIKPALHDSQSNQEVYSSLLTLLHRMEGMNIPDKDKLFVILSTLMERKMSQAVRKEWIEKVQEKSDYNDPLGSRARMIDLTSCWSNHINKLSQLPNDKAMCKENYDKRIMGKKPVAMIGPYNRVRPPNRFPIRTALRGRGQTYASYITAPQRGPDPNNCPFCNTNHTGWMACTRMPADPTQAFNILRRGRRCYSCGKFNDENHRTECNGARCRISDCNRRHLTRYHEALRRYIARPRTNRPTYRPMTRGTNGRTLPNMRIMIAQGSDDRDIELLQEQEAEINDEYEWGYGSNDSDNDENWESDEHTGVYLSRPHNEDDDDWSGPMSYERHRNNFLSLLAQADDNGHDNTDDTSSESDRYTPANNTTDFSYDDEDWDDELNNQSSTPHVQTTLMPGKNAHGLLRTCTALIRAPGQKPKPVVVALDSLSQVNLIKRDLAQAMHLKGEPCKLQMTVAGGSSTESTPEKKVSFDLEKVVFNKGTSHTFPITATTVKQISTPLDAINVDPKIYPHLKDLPFTEQYPCGQREIDILIGEPLYSALEMKGRRTGKATDPVAVETKLGWVLAGTNPDTSRKKLKCHFTITD